MAAAPSPLSVGGGSSAASVAASTFFSAPLASPGGANSGAAGANFAFSSGAGGIAGACHTCKKSMAIDCATPVHESALLAFNSAFHLTQAGHTATDLLSESFVVLPANKLASAFAPPGSSLPAAMGGVGMSLASRLAQNKASGGGLGIVPEPPASSTAAANAAASAAAKASTTGQQQGTGGFDKQVQAVSRVLEIVLAQCPVSAPLCTHCSAAVMTELDKRIQEMERDRDEYVKCLRSMQAPISEATAAQQAAEDAQEAEEEAQLAQQELELEEKLAALRTEKDALSLEYDSLDAETTKLSEYESQFWREYEEYSLALTQVTEEQAHMKSQIKNANDALERMKRTNVFDDAFHISHDGHFATINGFRLGRLPSQPVEWAETSAALGQVLLLLHTMARHTQYKFHKYRLQPMGSYSKMAKLDDLSTTYELYGSNDLILGRLFWYRRFDTALVWLLACIQEFGEFASSSDGKFQLKYSIKNDLIGDVSIKLQFNNDAKWTKALKNMATNLKFLLAWCSTRKQS